MIDLNKIGTGQKLLAQVMARNGIKENPSTRLKQLDIHNSRKKQPPEKKS